MKKIFPASFFLIPFLFSSVPAADGVSPENKEIKIWKIYCGDRTFSFKPPVEGKILTALEVEEWETIFVGVQTSPVRFEILAVSTRDEKVSLIDLDTHYYADGHIFPLEPGATLTLAPLNMETTPNGRSLCSYPVISHPRHEGDPAHDSKTSLSIQRLEDGSFEARSNR